MHGLHVSDMGSQWLCLIQWLQVNGCMSFVVFSLLACQWLSVNEDWCDQGLNVNNG